MPGRTQNAPVSSGEGGRLRRKAMHALECVIDEEGASAAARVAAAARILDEVPKDEELDQVPADQATIPQLDREIAALSQRTTPKV